MSPALETRESRAFASEVKFLVTSEVAAQIRDWARGRLAPDPHAAASCRDGYQVTSLYFDTERSDVYHRRGSFGRSKYRIRRYGASESAFLERKAKSRGGLTKRRSVVALDELERLTEAAPDCTWSGFWFQRRLRLRGLEPVCQIAYHRTARVARTSSGPIRLTLDEHLRALPAAGWWFSEREGEALLEGQVIVELKFLHQTPVLFKQLIEEFALNPQPCSKYRLAAWNLALVANAFAQPGSRAHLEYA